MNKFTVKRVNEKGLKRIREILKKYHREVEFTDSQIWAWAADVEKNIADHNSAHLEIPSRSSVSRKTEVFTIPESCLEELVFPDE